METNKEKIVVVSGGFDPIKIGHMRLLNGARHFGKLVIILNSDKWILRNKGILINKWQDRKEILMAIEYVSDVVSVNDDDDTVCEAILKIKPAMFANGGKRGKENTAEKKLCKELDICMLWGIGGGEYDEERGF